MTIEVMSIFEALGGYVLLAVTAMTVENSVLFRGVGISRLFSLINDTVDLTVFSILLCFCTTSSGVGFYYLNKYYLAASPYARYLRPLGAVLCMVAAFLIVGLFATKLVRHGLAAKAIKAMPIAAFNCTVLGTLLLSYMSHFSLIETIVFCAASSVGFTLSVFLVTEGQRKLQGRDMPASFRGLPATLLYLAGLAMAVYGLTGHTFSL